MFLPVGTMLASRGTTLAVCPTAVCIRVDSFGYLNSLSSSSSVCRRNAHNDLVLGFKKVGGIKEVDFVYHTACLKGS